ncbi:MAG: hypothetical protein ACI93R_001977 [Flavobacteriales bacterium]|jgi:hypothetical protein
MPMSLFVEHTETWQRTVGGVVTLVPTLILTVGLLHLRRFMKLYHAAQHFTALATIAYTDLALYLRKCPFKNGITAGIEYCIHRE